MNSYQLNKLLFNFKEPEKVREALNDEAALLLNYKLNPEEIQALKAEDLEKLYHLGANPYLIRTVYRNKYQY